MYTGTLIRDLMAAVERAEQRQIEEERELQAIFDLQIRLAESNHVFIGAA
ncbi:MAG: hypothetical protein ABSE40_05930 [Candidatus Sulfotelmatobacter sp.]|jgi:hypothetical protein